jgi:hypothetical protein
LQLFHVLRFNVHDVERIVPLAQMPKVDAKVVCRDEGLVIATQQISQLALHCRAGATRGDGGGKEGRRQTRRLTDIELMW